MPVARRSTELEKRIRNFAWMLGQGKMSKVRFRVGLVMLLWCRGPGARREESQRKVQRNKFGPDFLFVNRLYIYILSYRSLFFSRLEQASLSLQVQRRSR
jgi:hypothetical protein